MKPFETFYQTASVCVLLKLLIKIHPHKIFNKKRPPKKGSLFLNLGPEKDSAQND
jgi:hypothetical protein